MFNVFQNWEMDALQLFLFDGAYSLLAVMAERDESSRLRMASQQFGLATRPY